MKEKSFFLETRSWKEVCWLQLLFKEIFPSNKIPPLLMVLPSLPQHRIWLLYLPPAHTRWTPRPLSSVRLCIHPPANLWAPASKQIQNRTTSHTSPITVLIQAKPLLSLSRSLSWMIAGPHRWSPHFYFRLFLVCFQQHSQKEPFEKQVRSRPSAPNSAGKNRVLPKACTSDPGPSAPLLPLSALPLCRATHACPRTLHWRFFLLRTPSAQILPGLVPHFLQLPGRPALTAP